VSDLILYAIPGFIFLLLLELALTRYTSRGKSIRGYEVRDTFASLAMGIGYLITKIPVVGTIYVVNSMLFEHRIFELSESAWWFFPALLVCEDFCYYWFHRLHHEVRLLWAAHINHHSSQHYNLSTALRQSWTTAVTAPIFWVPLPLIGFSPEMVLTAQSISLLYQYWIHTELIGSMGPFGWIFNTPAHHRVHHGRNAIYLDRNHGGTLIIWDRLFGTFEKESIPVDFGLTTNISTFNPFRIAFHEYAAIGRDLKGSKKLSQALAYVFAPPGWSHDGSRKTSTQMRAAEAEAEAAAAAAAD
jgi:sterol desaturase/sphingolipid hydroxylase (fatty acid hydroxylase superfamily)